ncbi:uncharacterized protein LOC111354702 [Spodoptera litura]|uniref:2-phosphoxylose phosphatase 1 n=1 Tax=Spodoptera litura TaxID=69820 RepID=A0A9J7E850_SPOLT|nr:uncharacterized protein LOC111354702 [Spodoptera litura]
MAAGFIVFMCIVVASKGIDINSLKLEQVVMLGRHNVRTPLTEGLEMYSSKPWPKWNSTAGVLTEKGLRFEGYIADYISQWLDSEDFFEGCPQKDDVLIYANTKSRTLESARAFAESAFYNCNISVQHYANLSQFDPLFLPVFHNKTEAFKKQIAEEMKRHLSEMNLTESYAELGRILNIEEADICKKLFLCDLNSQQTEIVLEEGEEPNVNGPLYIANAVVDAFIMSYYEGRPMTEVAWGQIETDRQWDLLAKIITENQNIRFKLESGAKDIASPLLRYMFNIFNDGKPKFALLVGHDSNLNSVLTALEFKPFERKLQFEPYPIGGKIVFQKYSDKMGQYLKVEYIYPTTKQLRGGDELSSNNEPQRIILELKGCPISPTGYCPWSEFLKLNEILDYLAASGKSFHAQPITTVRGDPL